MTNLIVLPDGTQISSGPQENNAIGAMSFTQCVNSGQELTLGSVCSNMVELTLITPNGGLSVQEGQELQVYRVSENGTRFLLGLFTAEKPVKAGSHALKVTAYDRASRLDKDMTEFLNGLQAWPYRLKELAKMVCDACNVELKEGEIPNGEYAVQRFTAQNITGRKLMRWIAELSGRFCRVTPEGKLEFAWYTPNDTVQVGGFATHIFTTAQGLQILHPRLALQQDGQGNVEVSAENAVLSHDGQGNVTLSFDDEKQVTYRNKGLTYKDYQVKPVERVQIKCSKNDVGTVWPEDLAEDANTYVIGDNMLLSADSADALRPIAQALYEQLCTVTYTPCTVKLPVESGVQAGDILTLTDGNGAPLTVYIMHLTQTGHTAVCQCSGSARRETSAVFNRMSASVLSGKVMELMLNVDGLVLENRNAAGNFSKLSATVGGMEAEVQSQQENIALMQKNISQLRQDSRQVQISISQMQTEGTAKVCTETGYTFDQKGLSIRKEGSQMENLLDDTGMYVKRLGEVVLQANDEGVQAVDVSVKNYLIVGEHARLEDYSSAADLARTACFYI